MLFELFIIFNVLGKITAIPQFFKRDNEAVVWIYNEYLDMCLYLSDFVDEPVIYDYCDNTKSSKWYLCENDDGIYFKSVAYKDMCISSIKNKIVLSKCDENSVMKYIEASKFIKSKSKCLSVLDGEDDPDYLTLTNCDRNNKKLLFEISYRKPNKKGTTNTTTTTTTTTTTITTSAITTTKQSVPTINYKDKPKFIYNSLANKCLFAQAKLNQPPLIKSCKNNNMFKWILSPYPEGYLFSYAYTDRCLSVTNNIKMDTCNNNINTFKYTGEGTIYPSNNNDECLSTTEEDNDNDDNVYLNTCYDFDNQIWSFWDTNPYDIINVETQNVWVLTSI